MENNATNMREWSDLHGEQGDAFEERKNPKADPDCPYCHGLGYVTDWVDYGSTTVPMNTGCNCLEEPGG